MEVILFVPLAIDELCSHFCLTKLEIRFHFAIFPAFIYSTNVFAKTYPSQFRRAKKVQHTVRWGADACQEIAIDCFIAPPLA
ncbi:hypothetical protein Pla144_09750 [Bythopirellula polymerisocia]|uniref:Uncharacterized protein n=1 Tax=Bythopirellula polymerisocia TaxID=2528003 RepID=A0A5C6D5L4_9BACT|nr:hypothetical protein Pla144_09750 [Bythopirellula polymerisocia]